MPQDHGYTILLSGQTEQKVKLYLNDLKRGLLQPGHYVQLALDECTLSSLNILEFLEILMNTKKPQIYAESSLRGDGRDWNSYELSILGDISIAVPVIVFDDATHTHPEVHDKPFGAHLIYVPGALLHSGYGSIPADFPEVVTNGNIDAIAYKSLYERRLLPGLLYANNIAISTGKKAFVTIPGLGCGCFAGSFHGEIEPFLSEALESILSKHQARLQGLEGVYFDPYNQLNQKTCQFGNITYMVRPLQKMSDKGFPQLSKINQFENGSFAECMLFSFVAWDHVSWPGNDFYIGSRNTDDGVKAAATSSMHTMTNIEGNYNPNFNKYLPPPEFGNWYDVVKKNKLRLQVVNNTITYSL